MNLLYIDLFCGAGGTSTGVESARVDGKQCAKVIACVNHDKNAIASHAANHPDALHFTEDIRTLQLSPLVDHTARMRKQYPDAHLVLWASLECTNFSKAKGGLPRDADSRTLAEHLFRYIEALNPDYIQIENVEEFMSWGDMDDKGKPISRDKGKCYVRWCNRVRRYGYDYEYRILNSADFGAYTRRKRFFGCFAKHGLPIVWPEPTHCKMPVDNGLFGSLPKWRAVEDMLDLEDEGKSIFGRKRPLKENTLIRIYAGLIKFVAGGKDAFLVKYNSMSQRGKYIPPSMDEPCPTITVQQRLGLCKVHFISKQFSGDPYSKNSPVDEPAGAITTKDHHAFITVHYGNGYNCSIEEPAPTITTKDRLALVTTRFIDMQYGNGTPASIDEPAPTITANPKHHLVTCVPGGETPLTIEPTDSPMMRKIKEFMAMYGVGDIFFRMFKIVELKCIQGFAKDYILIGTQEEQKKYIGNAVEVRTACAWCETLCRKLAALLSASKRPYAHTAMRHHAPMYKCTDSPTALCTDGRMYKCTNGRIYK